LARCARRGGRGDAPGLRGGRYPGDDQVDAVPGAGAGPWTKAPTLRWAHKIHQELGTPISGSNGIFDLRDAIEFNMGGAGIVQTGSVLIIKDVKRLPNVIKGIERFMDEHGHEDVASMHGLAARKAVQNYSEQFSRNRVHAAVNHDTCKNPTCTVCIQMFIYGALSQSA
jgi:hypothetical protein